MSAGSTDKHLAVDNGFDCLAPKFRAALEAALEECNANGLDAYAYETIRSDELQKEYFKRGRPPTPEYPEPVTNAQDARHAWHIYGLAADIISRKHEWKVTEDWRRDVNIIMRKHGLSCGADWPHPDLPHVQWGKCRISPSIESRSLYATGGNQAVWQAVGAI